MINKRFTVNKNDKLINILDNGEPIGNIYQVCGLLNKLDLENQVLERKIEYKNDYINKLLFKPKLTDILPDAVEILAENKIFKEKSEQKQKHIVHLEDKIHRMREQIKKLEYLYHYRTCEIERLNQSEVEAYKKENLKLEEKNGELKLILKDIIEHYEMKIRTDNESLYSMRVIMDGKTFKTIQEVIHD